MELTQQMVEGGGGGAGEFRQSQLQICISFANATLVLINVPKIRPKVIRRNILCRQFHVCNYYFDNTIQIIIIKYAKKGAPEPNHV